MSEPEDGRRLLDPGEVVFRPGDPSSHAFVIESGQIEILKDDLDQPLRIALLGDGEIFGEMGLVDERPRSLTARAVGRARIRAVDRESLLDLLFQRPEEGLRYLRVLFERLRAMNTRAATSLRASQDFVGGPVAVRVTLFPLSPQARQVVPHSGLVLERFPFRIGRASRRERDPLEVNDLSLPDVAPYRVSRNHLCIDLTPTAVVVRDRGSYLGTIVNGIHLGGSHKEVEATLSQGANTLALGTDDSPFRFRLVVEAAASEER